MLFLFSMLRTATWTCSDPEVTFVSKQRPSSQSEANDSDADGHSRQLMLVAAASTVWTRGPRSAQDQRRRGQDSKEVCSGITLSGGGQAHRLAESGQHALLRQADAELPSQGPARHQPGGRQPSMEGRRGGKRHKSVCQGGVCSHTCTRLRVSVLSYLTM